MKKVSHLLTQLLCIIVINSSSYLAQAQQCSPDALTAKYWQYRQNLNSHFVMNDRKPEGCIGNGLTRNEADLEHLDCNTDLLHGYGLPATSIVMAPEGSGGMIERNTPSTPNQINSFLDGACADAGPDPGINWNPPGVGHSPPYTEKKFNWIEYGSETPHQIGWYLITLSTEYALLGKNGQFEEQQRTLEDLFLALQAYRRLDITANCLVRKRYDEIRDQIEVCDDDDPSESCLCPDKYHNSQCPGDSKWHFDIECQANCGWQPNLSGYSGFFIREDATQEQEGLHDPSEDKWNIDLVGSAFAMSMAPPCTTAVSQTCYLEHHVGFLSQDQLFSIMLGLAVAQKFIPPDATVTTCDGSTFKPYDMIQDMAKGFVELPQNSTRHIFWPGSDDCCDGAIKFGECAGGNFQWTYAGLEYMYNAINDDNAGDHNIGFLDRNKWGTSFGREVFFAEAMGVAMDYNQLPKPGKFIGAALDSKKEIMLLINDVLYPQSPNLVGEGDSQEELKNYFQQLLCSAPCEGTCIKPYWYDVNRDEEINSTTLQRFWPEFECPNTPEWTGQRWEGDGGNPDWWNIYQPRQFNGLDFMALYNLYMLRFPQEQTPFYNPDRPEPVPSGHLLGEGKIEGPSVLCPGQSGVYSVISSYPISSSLNYFSWSGTNNISYSNNSTNPTTATLNVEKNPSIIRADFVEDASKKQYYLGVPYETIAGVDPSSPLMNVSDECQISYEKTILTTVPNYTIDPEVNDCTGVYEATAVGPNLPGIVFKWEAVNNNNSGFHNTGSGQTFDFEDAVPPPHHPNGQSGSITLTLKAQTDCGSSTTQTTVEYEACEGFPKPLVRVSPNPAQNQITVDIRHNNGADFVTTDPNGIHIRVYPVNGSTTYLDTYLYYNGQTFNSTTFPTGMYNIQAYASDLIPVQTTFSILH